MQMMKWSVMALAIAAATTQMAYADVQDDAAQTENLSSQAKSNGFLEDSTAELLSRNFAFNRDYKNNDSNTVNEWAQGEMLTLTSGFTQGTVGFGVYNVWNTEYKTVYSQAVSTVYGDISSLAAQGRTYGLSYTLKY